MEKLLVEQSKKPLLRSKFRPKALEVTHELLHYAQYAADNLRGWEYRNIKKLISELPDSFDQSRDLKDWIILCWVKLKILVSSFHELGSYARFLWKNCLVPDGQSLYGEAMDVTPIGWNFPFEYEKGHTQLAFLKSMALDPYVTALKSVKDKRLWVPISTFPLWNISSEGKMHLSEVPPPTNCDDEFRTLVKKFLFKYAPKQVVMPSPLAAKKVGGQKYNDGGTVRRDSERPQLDYNSGFLYQKFVTKPGQSREVWLPGKATKDNNGWWMIFVDSLLRKVPYSALGKESHEIYAAIQHRIQGQIEYFDVSGFGLQYPRNYLSICIEEIAKIYPSDSMEEMSKIALEIFSKVEVEMPDGKFKYPSRGIGLGYYENLKTLGVMAIIDSFDPISVYGDQALLGPKRASDAYVEMEKFGFLFTKNTKKLTVMAPLKWSGDIMSKTERVTPRSVWSGIFGALTKEFHWERKTALAGAYADIPREYIHIWKRLTYQYERAFGPEFYKGESMRHPSNMGLDPEGLRTTGWIKDWKVRKLSSPSDIYENGILMNIPFVFEVKEGKAKAFSKTRKNAYRRVKPFDSNIIDYIDPEIELNMKRRPVLGPFARSLPRWAEVRMFLLDAVHTGKLVSGLKGEEIALATIRQKFAPDPWMARATGGYRIITDYRTNRPPSMEMVELSEAFIATEYFEHQFAVRVLPRGKGGITENPYLQDLEDEEEVASMLLQPEREDALSFLKNLISNAESQGSEEIDPPESSFSQEEIEEAYAHTDHDEHIFSILTELAKEFVPDVLDQENIVEVGDDIDIDFLAGDYEIADEEESGPTSEVEPTLYGWKL